MSDFLERLKLVERLSKLYVALVSDTLDLEYGGLDYNKYLMSSDIRPALPDMRIAGIAHTLKGAPTTKREPSMSLEDLRKAKWVLALESIKPGHVIVYDTSNCRTAACWGELISNAARARGAVGAVVDGFVRDINRLLWIKPTFPVFATGFTAADSYGRFELIDYNINIELISKFRILGVWLLVLLLLGLCMLILASHTL
jgi:regulator of RNase E activity RraA